MGNKKSTNKTNSICLSYTNGDKFEGEIKDSLRDGFGTYYYHNGDKYEGMWLKGKKHGMGTLYYKEGNLFVGHWKNSEKEGIGTLYTKSGEKFYGEFKLGKRNGIGILTSPDNNKYIGYFKDSRKNGIGIMHYNKGKIAMEEWDLGILISSKILSLEELNKLYEDNNKNEKQEKKGSFADLSHNIDKEKDCKK
jgi:hypothetical protein